MTTEKAVNYPSEKENRLAARFGFVETPEESVDSILNNYVYYDQETSPFNEASSTIAPTINEQAWEALVAGNSLSAARGHSRNSSASSRRRSLIAITSRRRSLCEMMCEAASIGDVPQIGRLLGAGADLKKKSKDGLLPVHLAAAGGHLSVLKSLAMHGAKMDATDQCGRTALHAAVLGRQTAVIPFLVQSGVPVEAKDSNGCTALHLAAQMEAEGPEELDLANAQNNKVRFSYVFGASKAARRVSTCSASSTSHTPLEALLRIGAYSGNVRIESRL
jgi:ankyrin repeat protein